MQRFLVNAMDWLLDGLLAWGSKLAGCKNNRYGLVSAWSDLVAAFWGMRWVLRARHRRFDSGIGEGYHSMTGIPASYEWLKCR